MWKLEFQPGDTAAPKCSTETMFWGLAFWEGAQAGGAQEAGPDCPSLFTGHGNHRESSPFLSPLEASRGSDYYDRNLALFEVAEEPFWVTGLADRGFS